MTLYFNNVPYRYNTLFIKTPNLTYSTSASRYENQFIYWRIMWIILGAVTHEGVVLYLEIDNAFVHIRLFFVFVKGVPVFDGLLE